MPRTQISAYASQARAKARKAEGGEAPTRSRGTATAGIPAGFGDDVKAIKELIERVGGAEELKDLAGTISSLEKKYGVAGLDSLIDAFGE
jgi:hypothetical protein